MIMRTMSNIIERIAALRQIGVTHNGRRDIYEALGYEREIVAKDYEERYRRDGLARRIVNIYPKATWRRDVDNKWGTIFEEQTPDVETQFEQEWESLEKRLKIWSLLQRADILSGMGRYSVLYLGTRKPGALDTELPKGLPDDLVYLRPFSESSAKIASWEEDATSERFGQPKTYQLTVRDVTASMLSKVVHWSRVIHIAEDTLDNDYYGNPRLEAVWNYLNDLDKVRGGGAEAFWIRANQGLHIDLDREIGKAMSEADKTAFAAEVEKYEHQISRVLKTRGVDVKTLGSDVADFKAPSDAIQTLIAGALGIPKRILFGSEMGELASTQDRDNWDTQVHDRRMAHAGPNIVHSLVDRLIAFNYLSIPKQYFAQWPPKQNLTETETIDLGKKLASVNDHYPGEIVVEPNEVREFLGYDAIDELDREAREDRQTEDAPDVARLEQQLEAARGPVVLFGRRG